MTLVNPVVAVARRLREHRDFLILFVLFAAYRLGSILLLRPGGYVRDYSDLIYYLARASAQDSGYFPYRDYWSEYPPLAAWLPVWVDRISREIPVWEEPRLWFALLFGSLMVLGECATLLALYLLARRMWAGEALRPLWQYAGLLLPVYFVGGWYDALPVATLLVGLALLTGRVGRFSAPATGVVLAIGGLLKLVPLALVVVPWVALERWRARLTIAVTAVGLFVAGYGVMALWGPVMTAASLRSLVDRSGWGTLVAWANGRQTLGAVVGDIFDPAAEMALYVATVPSWLGAAPFVLAGGLVFVRLLRRGRILGTADTVRFTGLMVALMLLAYPAWNPQYALYLLPLLPLIWPYGRGALYALLLSAAVVLEFPLYHILVGPEYPPEVERIIPMNFRELYLALILIRTWLLAAIALDLGAGLLHAPGWVRRAAPVAAALALAAMVWVVPRMGQAYALGRFAASPLRAPALYLNGAASTAPIWALDQATARGLRPFLVARDRLHVVGVYPSAVATPTVADFWLLGGPGDGKERIHGAAWAVGCADWLRGDRWRLWRCGAPAVNAQAVWEEGIHLAAVAATPVGRERVHLTLLWSTHRTIAQDFTVFAHLVDAEGALVGQWDQVPAQGGAPTTSWRTDRLVLDDSVIPVARPDAPQPWTLRVGWYDAQSGRRLPLVAAEPDRVDDAVVVATFGNLR